MRGSFVGVETWCETLGAFVRGESQNPRGVGKNGKEVEVAEVEVPAALGEGGGNDVTLRGGDIDLAAYVAVTADGDDLALIGLHDIEAVVVGDHVVGDAIGLEVIGIRVLG